MNKRFPHLTNVRLQNPPGIAEACVVLNTQIRVLFRAIKSAEDRPRPPSGLQQQISVFIRHSPAAPEEREGGCFVISRAHV
jgi:hypothetical protein